MRTYDVQCCSTEKFIHLQPYCSSACKGNYPCCTDIVLVTLSCSSLHFYMVTKYTSEDKNIKHHNHSKHSTSMELKVCGNFEECTKLKHGGLQDQLEYIQRNVNQKCGIPHMHRNV